MAIDFESDVQDNSVADGDLKRVSHMAGTLIEAAKTVTRLEGELKQAKEQVRKLSEEDLPALMDEVGLAEFKTSDGHQITVEEGVFANISSARAAEAFQWLRDNGHGALIKNVVAASFGKGDDEAAQKLYQQLAGEYKQVSHKEDIHWQTLRAFVREQREQGTPVPEALFGVYVRRTAKVTD